MGFGADNLGFVVTIISFSVTATSKIEFPPNQVKKDILKCFEEKINAAEDPEKVQITGPDGIYGAVLAKILKDYGLWESDRKWTPQEDRQAIQEAIQAARESPQILQEIPLVEIPILEILQEILRCSVEILE